MKKAMIGLLVLIPIIILLVVALVTNIVSLNAHIAVEDLQLTYKGTQDVAYLISIPIEEGAICLYDYIDARVYPDKATSKTVEWQIAGDVEYTDESYEKDYENYISMTQTLARELSDKFGDGSDIRFDDDEMAVYNAVVAEFYYSIDEKDSIIGAMVDRLLEEEKLYPAAVLVGEEDQEVVSNTTGNMIIGSYCNFTVRAVAENVSKTISISIVGYDVEHVSLAFAEGENNTLYIGKSMRLLASYTPIQSIVNETIWTSSDESVLSVDGNGVVTAKCASVTPVTITLQASVYSTENSSQKQYVEGKIEIDVKSTGVSSIYGEEIVTNKSTLTLEEIGLPKGEIPTIGGGELENGIITITSTSVTLTYSGERQFFIKSCRNGEIAIANSAFFVRDNGYVLSVGENSLKLTAVWADMLKEGSPESVAWSSSDKSIATVDANGNVVGVADGIVTITAKCNNEIAEIEINVRRKLSSIQLRTSDEALAIGLARETVFASEKYIDVASSNAKMPNSANIIIQGEPDDATEAELSSFYASFAFEIVEGKDFAHMDESIQNKVVFDSSLLEGKGKQKVVVRVSAKYPKYEAVTKYTTKDVTLTVVYGVAVNNIEEFKVASSDQEAYVKAEGNLMTRSDEEKKYWVKEGVNEVYKVYKNDYSLRNYAIVLNDNCMYEERLDDEGNTITWIDWNDIVALYGNLYGNNKKIYATRGSAYDDKYVLRVAWGGITVSNVILRGNEIGEEELDANSVSGFDSNVCEVNAGWSRWSEEDGNNVTFEYTIIENGNKGVNLYNTDILFKGCVIRNMTECGIYAPYRMNYTSGEKDEASGKQIVYPSYSHINLHNVICSNTLGSMMSVAYETVTMKTSTVFRFVDGKKYIGDDEEELAQSEQLALENERFFLENFYSDDINMIVNQTGFLRAYNWMNINDAGLIPVGDDTIENILSTMFGKIVEGDQETFDEYLYKTEDGEQYLHFAFIVSGVKFNKGVLDAPSYLKLNMQDADYDCFNIQDVNFDKIDFGNSLANAMKPTLKSISLKVYGYDKEAEITPFSTYTLNSALIQELHE